MAGRLAPEKRHDVMVNAIRLSKHADRIALVVTGAGRGEDHVRSLASGLTNVSVAGFLSRADLVRLYNTADLLVHCSEVELEGMAVLEAMSVGLPALVAQAPQSAASAFAIDDDFRFPAGDSVALAARLDRLIERPDLVVAARDRAQAFAKRFDFISSVEALEQLYRSVTGADVENADTEGSLAA
jgi:1,2-diacylglycerol 3-alpha-glucosyltransferase